MKQILADLRSRRARKRVLLLVVTDFLCVITSFLAAYWIRLLSGLFISRVPLQPFHFLILTLLGLLWVSIFSAHGLYKRETYLSGFDQMVGIFNSVNLGALIVLAAAFVFKFEYFLERRLVLLLAWSFSIILLSVVRLGIIRAIFLKRIQRDPFRCRILVVGAGETGQQFVQLIRHTKNHVFEIVGFLDDDPEKQNSRIDDVPVLGNVDDVVRIVEKGSIERIFVAVPRLHQEELIDLISRCMKAQVPVKMISDQFQMFASDASIERIDGVPTFQVRENRMRGLSYVAKRTFDTTIAAIFLVILAPFFGLLALLVKVLGGPGPVFFRQVRAGQGGKPFPFYKFRTMRTDMDDQVHRDYAKDFVSGKDLNLIDEEKDTPIYKMAADPRVTAIGAFLRKTSLDELPQLWNVIRGEMSLVGPRPPILYELQYYREWHRRRLDAKPGLTGLWQVSGRSSVPFNEMVLLDLYYIDHWSLKLDIEILVRTVPVILFSKGAY